MIKKIGIIAIHAILILGLMFPSCRTAVKKGAQTAVGARGDLIWIAPLKSQTRYDTVVVTPLINELRDQLPYDVEAQVKESIRKAFTEEVPTPGLVVIFADSAHDNQIQMNNRVIVYDDVLDSRLLVVRIDLIKPRHKTLIATANVISRMSGFRNDSEVAKGIGQGMEEGMELIYQKLTENAEQNLENFGE